MRFVLASGSPARLATLRAAGMDPEVLISGVDESSITAPDTATLVEQLAGAKARAASQRIEGDALVLGCDSMLELEHETLGKPSSPQEAVALWRRMQGRSGVLHTGHVLIAASDGVAQTHLAAVASTRVHFAEISDDELDAYIATGEPLAVAGAFTIDGLGGWFIDSIGGDHHNVVGLSLPLLRRMLRRLGLSLTDLGWPRSPVRG
jgi:septum formation protein